MSQSTVAQKRVGPHPEKVSLSTEYGRTAQQPKLSVVIVAYNTNEALIDCLEGLKGQSEKEFETLVMDNGKNDRVLPQLARYDVRYFRLAGNYGCSTARNIGAYRSKAPVVCFLDDDAVPHKDFVHGHLNAYRTRDIDGLRGKCLWKTKSVYNLLQDHYDFGDEVFPAAVAFEANCSFRKAPFVEADGFDPVLYGHEGYDLSYRIYKQTGDKSRLLYFPEPVVYHDYANDFKKFFRKEYRQLTGMRKSLLRAQPDILEYIRSSEHRPAPPEEIRLSPAQRVELAFLRLTLRALWIYAKFYRAVHRLNG